MGKHIGTAYDMCKYNRQKLILLQSLIVKFSYYIHNYVFELYKFLPDDDDPPIVFSNTKIRKNRHRTQNVILI